MGDVISLEENGLHYVLGSTGAGVRLIQTALKARGLYAHQVNGIFGEETELAVKAFQKTNGLVGDGFVAAETWR